MTTHRHPDAAEIADDVARLIADVAQLGPAVRHAFLAETFHRWPKTMRSLAGAAMGRYGGRKSSPAKTKAVRENAAKGGRPRKPRDPQLDGLMAYVPTVAAPFLL